jgi:glucosamine--fructose-6-phosphate aminotransferase (isomerizing)
MCGIFGIITEQEETLGPILIEAGKRLAYRGYDSVGCATVTSDGTIDLRKDVGRIEEVSAALDFPTMRGYRGITQLRWATSIPTATWSAPTTATWSTTSRCASCSCARG